MPPSEPDRAFELLVNDLLTFIEQREAEQIVYGIYDVTMIGAEALAAFRPLSVVFADEAEHTNAVRAALQTLGERLDLLRLDPDPHAAPDAWVFRSRIAEMVRLIHLVRQRIVFAEPYRNAHRLSSGKRLVADTTLTVMPRRDQASQEILERALNSSAAYRQVAALLVDVISHALPKLRSMIGFQHRPGQPIHRPGVHQPSGNHRRPDQYGRSRAGVRHHLYRALLAQCEIRTPLSLRLADGADGGDWSAGRYGRLQHPTTPPESGVPDTRNRLRCTLGRGGPGAAASGSQTGQDHPLHGGIWWLSRS